MDSGVNNPVQLSCSWSLQQTVMLLPLQQDFSLFSLFRDQAGNL